MRSRELTTGTIRVLTHGDDGFRPIRSFHSGVANVRGAGGGKWGELGEGGSEGGVFKRVGVKGRREGVAQLPEIVPLQYLQP